MVAFKIDTANYMHIKEFIQPAKALRETRHHISLQYALCANVSTVSTLTHFCNLFKIIDLSLFQKAHF